MNSLGLCGVTGKPIFEEQAAHDALAAFGRRKGSKVTHWCLFCGGHHMGKGVRGRPGKGKGRR